MTVMKAVPSVEATARSEEKQIPGNPRARRRGIVALERKSPLFAQNAKGGAPSRSDGRWHDGAEEQSRVPQSQDGAFGRRGMNRKAGASSRTPRVKRPSAAGVKWFRDRRGRSRAEERRRGRGGCRFGGRRRPRRRDCVWSGGVRAGQGGWFSGGLWRDW